MIALKPQGGSERKRDKGGGMKSLMACGAVLSASMQDFGLSGGLKLEGGGEGCERRVKGQPCWWFLCVLLEI